MATINNAFISEYFSNCEPTFEAIENTRKALIKKWHPDNAPSDADADEKLKQLNALNKVDILKNILYEQTKEQLFYKTTEYLDNELRKPVTFYRCRFEKKRNNGSGFCDALSTICPEGIFNIPDDITVIESELCWSHDPDWAPEIKKIIFPNTLRIIGEAAFRGCILINELDFSNIKTSLVEPLIIYAGAFSDNTSQNYAVLKNVKFPKYVKFASGTKDRKYMSPFDKTPYIRNMKTFEMSDKSTIFTFDDISLNCIFPFITDVSIRGISEIPNYYFSGCKNLKRVVMDNNVTKIGSGAFENCESLKYLELSDNIQEIGRDAFANSPSIQIFCTHKSESALNISQFNNNNAQMQNSIKYKGSVLKCEEFQYSKEFPAGITNFSKDIKEINAQKILAITPIIGENASITIQVKSYSTEAINFTSHNYSNLTTSEPIKFLVTYI